MLTLKYVTDYIQNWETLPESKGRTFYSMFEVYPQYLGFFPGLGDVHHGGLLTGFVSPGVTTDFLTITNGTERLQVGVILNSDENVEIFECSYGHKSVNKTFYARDVNHNEEFNAVHQFITGFNFSHSDSFADYILENIIVDVPDFGCIRLNEVKYITPLATRASYSKIATLTLSARTFTGEEFFFIVNGRRSNEEIWSWRVADYLYNFCIQTDSTVKGMAH